MGKREARSFYEIEAARQRWSVRELERQIAALLFERLSMSRDREKVLALAAGVSMSLSLRAQGVIAQIVTLAVVATAMSARPSPS
jgi:predicted nuclease of restriction endonuclease-like (RecB) superfamily